MSIDYEAARAVTQSGRIYELVGEPGSDPDTEYVWREWVILNSVERWDDITDDVWREIQKCQQQ